MPERAVNALRARQGALTVRLASPNAAGDLDALKSEIGALFKAVEQELAQLTALRADVLKMVESWKGIRAAHAPVAPQPSAVPQFLAEKPAVVHADHIGASTFIEKGWT